MNYLDTIKIKILDPGCQLKLFIYRMLNFFSIETSWQNSLSKFHEIFLWQLEQFRVQVPGPLAADNSVENPEWRNLSESQDLRL